MQLPYHHTIIFLSSNHLLLEKSPMSQSPKKKPEDLRSQQWFGRQDRDGFAYRSWVKGKGVPHDQFDGRPVIGICNTFSELTPCNSRFRTLAEQVKIGVYEAGGFPLEFPGHVLGRNLVAPHRHAVSQLGHPWTWKKAFAAIPIDGVVLLMGCDKTTPSLLMGASSVDLPTIGVSGGPMLNGKWRGQELGSGTGVWSMSGQGARRHAQTGQTSFEAESCMHRSHGHCMTMGTASTMASMVEALGVGLPEMRPTQQWTDDAMCWRVKRADALCEMVHQRREALANPDA
jgi:dihydroxy-acid dehydratase